MPTAFVGTWKNGNNGPVIGFLGEYDALPGLSQKPDPGSLGTEKSNDLYFFLMGDNDDQKIYSRCYR